MCHFPRAEMKKPLLSLPCCVLRVFSHVLIIKWLFLLHLGSECPFHKACASQLSSTHTKIRNLCFSCLDLPQGTWILSPKLGTSGLCLRPWEVLVPVRISSWEPLLPLSCLSSDPLCSFLSNQTGKHRSHMYTLSGRLKNINVSLSSCLKVEPFKEMSPHQEERCFS